MIGFFKPAAPKAAASDVKSTINVILIALGAVASFLGLAKLTDVVNYLLTNLDGVYAAVLTLVGVISGLVVYFKTPAEA